MRDEMITYLNIQTKWHKVDYETLDDDILRIIFVLYKDLNRKKTHITHLEYENSRLKQAIDKRTDKTIMQSAYDTLDEICEIWGKLDKAREDIKNLIRSE